MNKFPVYYSVQCWSTKAMIDWANQLRMDAVELDRPAAEAEDAERSKRFTAADIVPGYKFWHKHGYTRTVARVGGALYAALNDKYATESGQPKELNAFLAYLNGGYYTKIAS